MIDITQKQDSIRICKASGVIRLKRETIKKISENKIKTEKGNVFEIAKVIAFFGVKRTFELIPHCHQIPITNVSVDFEILDNGIKVIVKVKSKGKTGVEMDALTGTSLALLTIWDMVKYLEKDEEGQYPDTRITDLKIEEKIKK